MEELIERFVSIPRVEELLSTVDIDEEAEALLIRQREAVNSVLRSYSCYINSKDDEKKARWYDRLLRNLVTFRQREVDILKQDPVYFALVFMAAQSRNAPYLVKFETLKRIQNMRYESLLMMSWRKRTKLFVRTSYNASQTILYFPRIFDKI